MQRFLDQHDHHPMNFGFQHHLPHPPLERSKSIGNNSMLALPSYKPPSRRLSSGSACEVCRRRKTKCDGGQPCAYCATNGIECVHRNTRRKATNAPSPLINGSGASPRNSEYVRPSVTCAPYSRPSSTAYAFEQRSLSKQASCPSLIVTTHWPPASSSPPHKAAAGTERLQHLPSPSANDLYRSKEEMPSMMDQLSCRTFSTVVYPLSLSSATTTKPELASPLSRTCSSSSSNAGH